MQKLKTTFLTSIGAGLEYYDFIIYSMLAGFISKLFFPNENHFISLIETFAVFAIGYFARPIGGIIFGTLGDRIGRKKTFAATIFLMSISTLLIGVLPTYKTLGILAPILFLLFRIAQGIAFGAELPGAVTFLSEHADKNKQGFHCGIIIANVTLGVTLGSFITYLLTTFLSENQILSYGWRIPFLLGSVLAIVGFYFRKFTHETPAFLQLKNRSKFALVDLLHDFPKKILYGFFVVFFPGCFIVFVLCFPSYFHDAYHYTVKDISLAMTFGYLWSIIAVVFFGWLSDFSGQRKMLLITTLLIFFLLFFIFKILNFHTFSALLIFMLIYQTLISAMAASYFVILVQTFPTNVRNTAVALCYNLALSIAALTPIFVNYIYQQTLNIHYIPLLFCFLSLTTITALLINQKN